MLRTIGIGVFFSNLLEFVFLERLERRRPSAQGVVFCNTVEDMNAAIVEQGRLGDRALGRGGANIAASKRFITDLLNRFEAVAFGALVFVKRHRKDSVPH